MGVIMTVAKLSCAINRITFAANLKLEESLLGEPNDFCWSQVKKGLKRAEV